MLWESGDPGFNSANRFRNRLAAYFLPSWTEWYKAAYYDPQNNVYYDYPTGSDTEPTPVAGGMAPGTAVYLQPREQGPAPIRRAGGLSPYGTMAQGGNMEEWVEDHLGFDHQYQDPSQFRIIVGGSWNFPEASHMQAGNYEEGSPGGGGGHIGFRVASVPEPSTIMMGALATAGLLVWRRQLRKHRGSLP